jgi:hypothetical protein
MNQTNFKKWYYTKGGQKHLQNQYQKRKNIKFQKTKNKKNQLKLALQKKKEEHKKQELILLSKKNKWKDKYSILSKALTDYNQQLAQLEEEQPYH